MSRLSLPVAALALSLALVRPSPAQVAAPVAVATSGATLPPGTAAAEGFVPERLDRLHARLTRLVDDGEVAGLVTMPASRRCC